MQAAIRQTAIVLEMIKFQHTVFALPFAFTAMLMAAGGLPGRGVLFWIVMACVFARTAAMSFNRWADREIDKRNPRTAMRAIPAGQLSENFVLIFAVASAVGFVFSAAQLNMLALALSPLALVILLGYSLTKRFTSLAHFVLGLALALAPIGAWVAVQAEIGISALALGLGVLTWTAGFDLIYACQDVETDRNEGLFSVPSRYGTRTALNLSRALHILSLGFFIFAGGLTSSGVSYYAGLSVAALLLLAEHLIVDPHDMRKINLAFFTVNSWVGVAILAGTVADIMVFN